MDVVGTRIKDRIKEIKNIPTIPVTISRLIKSLQNENVSIDELSKIISRDQSIASRIVAAANSPFFGYPGRINSIEQSILMLGFDFTKSIALGVSIFSLFHRQQAVLKRMWAHSYGVATLSGLMCSKVSVANRGVCFLAGLLHDIGRALFIKLYSTEYTALMERDDIIAVETDAFQSNHGELGGWFLEDIFFPEEIVLPVSYHHDIAKATRHKGIATTVYLAEGLISLLNPDIACDGQWTEEHEKALEKSGLTEDDIKAYESVLHDELESVNNFFDL